MCSFGNESDKVYDDLDGINDMKTLPKEAFFGHEEDLYVWSGGNFPNLKTAIV